MNKQELKEQVSSLPSELIFKKVVVNKDSVLELIDQLDEPQKVVIPKFVAERIEDYKIYNTTLLNVYKVLGAKKDGVSIWVNDNIDLFARAWLDGYEIEKEKLYTVEIHDPHNAWKHTFLGGNKIGDISIRHSDLSDWRDRERNQLTEAEIKKDFEWAWQWAEPVGEVSDET